MRLWTAWNSVRRSAVAAAGSEERLRHSFRRERNFWRSFLRLEDFFGFSFCFLGEEEDTSGEEKKKQMALSSSCRATTGDRWSKFGHSWRSTASKAWSAFDQKRLEPAEGSTNLSQVWKAGMLPVSMAGPWIKSSVQSLTLCGVRGLVAETADCWVLFALELCSEDSGTWVQLASTISSSECSVSGDWSLLSAVTGVSESWGIPLHDLTCRPSPPALLKWRAHLGQISFGDSLSAVVICRMEQDFWCSIRPEGQSNDCWQRLQKVPGWASGRGRCAHNVKCLACPHSRLNDLPQNWQENPSAVFFP